VTTEYDNVVELSSYRAAIVELDVIDMAEPCDDIFVDEDRVIIRTGPGLGVAVTPLQAKELAVRLIEAACVVERT